MEINWRERRYCGQLRAKHQDREVLLMGWVDAIRDHGSLVFIHLRDVSGVVQVVFDPRVSPESYQSSTSLKEEYVVQVKGRVAIREKGTENPNIETGDIEVFATQLVILSESRPLPFPISEKAMVYGEEVQARPDKVDEELRLRYRYLDLRRPSMQALITARAEIMNVAREVLRRHRFVEVETPFLTRSTPEGARDYLVPSRLHPGKFYALPQSPQLFKQILMVSGMDRYFQIVKCFRDEDLRPNRQPEFTQLDLEASFIDEEFIYQVVEEVLERIFSLRGVTLQRPFPRLSYELAMELYGTDRPDTRFHMTFVDVTGVVKDTNYGIFRNIVARGGCVKGFCVRGKAGELSKNVLQNEYALQIAPSFGAKGMSWMKVTSRGLESNIVQFFSPSEQEGLVKAFEAREGDVLMMVADSSRQLVNQALGRLRLHVANRLGLIPEGRFEPVWITHFPLFELKDGELSSLHHPFTLPEREDFDPENKEELLGLKSRAYDIVINGEELGGGSLRIYRMETQRKIFKALGLSQEEVKEKFGFFLKALEYGAPPHGGLALGMDRVVAMVLGTKSIREIIAFPKNRSAVCPLTGAPAKVDSTQLQELHIMEVGEEELSPKPSTRTKKGAGPQTRKRISAREVKKVAHLARLSLTEEEIQELAQELDSIIGYVETLDELDTHTVPPTSHPLAMANVWREDKVMGFEEGPPVIENAPEEEGYFFKVPKILDTG